MKSPIDLSSLPSSPGCYLFKDRKGSIIYIGKAKELTKRVRSYFTKNHTEAKTSALVSRIHSFGYIVTDTEVEALILENTLIKKHRPRYNIDLKDSRRYAYIQVTSEEYPRLLVSRKREGTGTFYGPFTSAATRDYVLEALRRTFLIRTCKRLPKRSCLQYAIGLCSAPCIGKISQEEYLSNIRSCEMVLKGKTKKLGIILYDAMKAASQKKHYEKALEIKNQIEALRNLRERQKMDRQKHYDEDFIYYISHEGKTHLTLFHARNGVLESKQDFVFDTSPDILEEFLPQYYAETSVPKEIIVQGPVDSAIEAYLGSLRGSKVRIILPEKGEKKKLLSLVKKNLELSLFGDSDKLKDLKDKLYLARSPATIECFDISHLGGTLPVASMVQFKYAKPNKGQYRKFKIKTVDGIDDFAAIKEVVYRRYYKLVHEKLPFPDLIIIDGGKGQLSSALEALEELEIKIPIVAIAKREEELFIPGRKSAIKLSKRSTSLQLLQQIRDEAHRFAISYNRLLRKKKIRESDTK